MFNTDTEILFPVRVIPSLKNLRGIEWQAFVEEISSKSDQSVEKIAFTSLIVHLGGCGGCNADSFRAMRGCTQCARQTIRRFKGSDRDLIAQYEQIKTEVVLFLSKQGKVNAGNDKE